MRAVGFDRNAPLSHRERGWGRGFGEQVILVGRRTLIPRFAPPPPTGRGYEPALPYLFDDFLWSLAAITAAIRIHVATCAAPTTKWRQIAAILFESTYIAVEWVAITPVSGHRHRDDRKGCYCIVRGFCSCCCSCCGAGVCGFACCCTCALDTCSSAGVFNACDSLMRRSLLV